MAKNKSSTNLENNRRQTSDRVLTHLKMRGPQTTAELGERLGTTGENARQQLNRLAEEGLVSAHTVAGGVGRPRQLWHLTEAAQAHFPDSHSELTVSLIRAAREVFGQEGLDRLISVREAEMRRGYTDAVAGVDGIEARLERLAQQRTREGYMAEWAPAGDGEGWQFIENHCPICAAAEACQNFCRSELSIFREILGEDVTVERADHILAGARRCAYRVRPVAELP